MPQACLEGIVVGICHGGKPSVTAKFIGEGRPGAVNDASRNRIIHTIFPARPASAGSGHHLAFLAHTQAEGRVAGIRLQIGEQPMPLRPHVGHAEQRICPELALDGKTILVEEPG